MKYKLTYWNSGTNEIATVKTLEMYPYNPHKFIGNTIIERWILIIVETMVITKKQQ